MPGRLRETEGASRRERSQASSGLQQEHNPAGTASTGCMVSDPEQPDQLRNVKEKWLFNSMP